MSPPRGVKSCLLGVPVIVDPVSGFINMTTLFQYYGRSYSDVLVWMRKPYIVYIMDEIRRDMNSTTIIEADGSQNIWAHPALAISVLSIWSNTADLAGQILQRVPITKPPARPSMVTRGTQTPTQPTTQPTSSELDRIEQALDQQRAAIEQQRAAVDLNTEYLKTMADMLVNIQCRV